MLGRMVTPESVVQRQLEAYNAKDLPAWLATYAANAEQFELHGSRLAAGHAEMRERMAVRFSEPDLHAELLSRVVMGAVVVDHERITRNFPEGKGTVEMLCVYEVANGVITKASFALGAKQVPGHAKSAT
jgi:putative hydrolase of HD superfamily